jgi:hypothetical protein
MLYNECVGSEDDHGHIYGQHNCPGNARFCEVCGMKTKFFIDEILKPWQEVTGKVTDNPMKNMVFALPNSEPSDDDLPF